MFLNGWNSKTILISIDLWLGYATSLYGVHNQIITLIIYLCGKWRKYFLVDFWHDIALLLYVMYPHNWFWIDILKAIQLTKDSKVIVEWKELRWNIIIHLKTLFHLIWWWIGIKNAFIWSHYRGGVINVKVSIDCLASWL